MSNYNQSNICTYCGIENSKDILSTKTSEDRLPYKLNYHLYRCHNCDLIYTFEHGEEHLEAIKNYFKESYNVGRVDNPKEYISNIWSKFDDNRKNWQILLRKSLLHIPFRTPMLGKYPQGRIREGLRILDGKSLKSLLDVGSAFGDFVVNARMHGFEAYGLEPTEEIVKIIQKYVGPDIVHSGAFPKDTGPLEQYDSVTFFHTLIYFPVINKTIFQKLKSILSPNGVAMIFAYNTETLDKGDKKLSLLENPMATNFTSETFFRNVCDEFNFSKYERIPSYREKDSSYHILTV